MKLNLITLNKIGGGRPALGRYKGHLLILGQQLMLQLVVSGGEGVARGGAAWGDPIGVAGEEGEPIGRGAAHDDAVDRVLELPDAEGDDLRRGLRRIGLLGVDFDELSAVRFGGAVAAGGEQRRGVGEGGSG